MPAAFVGEYAAELETMQRQKAGEATTRSENYFEFRNVPCGEYWLTIEGPDGKTIYHGLVTIRTGAFHESVDLGAAEKRTDDGPGGTISVAALRRPPSGKALRAFSQSQKLAAAGDFQRAAVELQEAVRISPDWPEAHTNLAAQFLRLNHFEDAIAEARRAIELGKPNAVDLGNIAYAEYRLNRRDEALAAARAGLDADPKSVKLHYLFGSLLSMDRRTMQDAIPHLELAAREMEGARKNLEAVRKALTGQPVH